MRKMTAGLVLGLLAATAAGCRDEGLAIDTPDLPSALRSACEPETAVDARPVLAYGVDAELRILDARGGTRVAHRFESEAIILGAAAGRVLAGTADGARIALVEADGSLRWERAGEGGHALLADDGMAYLYGAGEGGTAIRLDGTSLALPGVPHAVAQAGGEVLVSRAPTAPEQFRPYGWWRPELSTPQPLSPAPSSWEQPLVGEGGAAVYLADAVPGRATVVIARPLGARTVSVEVGEAVVSLSGSGRFLLLQGGPAAELLWRVDSREATVEPVARPTVAGLRPFPSPDVLLADDGAVLSGLREDTRGWLYRAGAPATPVGHSVADVLAITVLHQRGGTALLWGNDSAFAPIEPWPATGAAPALRGASYQLARLDGSASVLLDAEEGRGGVALDGAGACAVTLTATAEGTVHARGLRLTRLRDGVVRELAALGGSLQAHWLE